MKVFEAYMVDSFVESAMSDLRKEFPTKTKGVEDKELGALIRQGLERAAKYGIDLEEDALRFVRQTIRLGSDFDTNRAHPWVGEILTRGDLSGTAKMNQLESRSRQLEDSSR